MQIYIQWIVTLVPRPIHAAQERSYCIVYNLLACAGRTMYCSSILSASVFCFIRRRAPTTSLHEALGVPCSHRFKLSRLHPPTPSTWRWLLRISCSWWCCTPRLSPSVNQSETLVSSLQRVVMFGPPIQANYCCYIRIHLFIATYAS